MSATRRTTPAGRARPTDALTARERAIFEALERVRARCDTERRKSADPVEFVHRYRDPLDQEIVALVASAMAFGNVKALRAKIDDALVRLAPDLGRDATDAGALEQRLRGWKHRVYRAEDLARLVFGARVVQREAGSLGARFAAELSSHGDVRLALAAWAQAIRRAGDLDASPPHRARRRGGAHILADPGKGSAVKRLMLMLRWMVRAADGVDLGLWDVPTSRLLVPVDTHIHKLAKNLGLTTRKTANWKTAVDITTALAKYDPVDPVKYDFALCHLGMLRRCPSRRDPVRCDGCGIKDVCRHWARKR